MAAITNVIPQFFNSQGDILNGGLLWIGKENGSPDSNVSDQIQLYIDIGKTLPISQPINIANGFAVTNQGTIIQLFPAISNSPVSVVLKNSNSVDIYRLQSVDIAAFLSVAQQISVTSFQANQNYKPLVVQAVPGTGNLGVGAVTNLTYNAGTSTFVGGVSGVNIDGRSALSTQADNALNAPNQALSVNSGVIANTKFVQDLIAAKLAPINQFIDSFSNRRWTTVSRSQNTVYTNTLSIPIGFRVTATYSNSCTLNAISDTWTCEPVLATINAYLGSTVADTESGSFPGGSYTQVANPTSSGTLVVEISVPPGGTYKWDGTGANSYTVQEDRPPA